MPVISFVSSKGGVGKSTTALVLACALAESGAEVALLDADPNQPLVAWAGLPGKPERVTVTGGITEDGMIDAIEAEARRAPFVLVDLEGSAAAIVIYAISRSDLVLIPCQGSQLDAAQAVRAARLVEQGGKLVGGDIPRAVVMTQVEAAITPRDLGYVLEDFERLDIPVLRTRMMRRAAFRTVFAVGGSLAGLGRDDVHNPAGARANAAALAAEVTDMLRARAAA